MSADSPEVRLEDITSILGDGLHGTPKYEEDGEYFFINGNNLSNGKIVFNENTKRASREEYLKYKKEINERTVLVSINGTLGNVAFYNGEKVFLGKSACYFNVVDDIDKKFVRYVISSKLFQDYITTYSTGTTIKNVSLKSMRDFTFRLPPINEQKQISKVLGDLDDKIELNCQINQTLEAMAQAIFKSWFVDFEPVKAKIAAIEAGENAEGVTRTAMSAISGKTDEELDQLQAEQPECYIQLKTTAELFPSAMQSSELGEIPEGWEVKSLYDCAQYINGAAFKSEDFSLNHKGLPIIKIRELKYGITSQTEFTKKEFDQKYRITNGEILFSWSGSPDTSIDIFLWTGGNGWLNQHTFRVIPQEAEEKEFIFFLLKFFKRSFIEIARNKQTTGLGHVTSKDLKNMFVTFPKGKVIKLFNDVGEPIVSQIFCNSIEHNNLSKIRDSLLPKLLSGELSIDAADFAEGN